MALNSPPSQDVQDIQFKLHDKFHIFYEGKDVKSLVSLLAVSSAKGLLFAGSSTSKELKVFKLRDVVDAKTLGKVLEVRVINLPGEPKVLTCSSDGSMLAINYVLNNTGFLQIYQVDSFVTPAINILYNLPVAPESHTFALQMHWNPVIANNIALILNDGSVAMFTLNSGGQYDKVTLGKEQQVKCGCWSPKGKQIVFGFAEGKLQQFKPNLQPARAIACPPGIQPGPFDCIAVHWLSTFQFAAIFLQRGQDMCPSLFIVNAPKAGQPTYINYYDVCYSAPGPRIHQLSFNHIAQWNLLLVTSANGVEVGVLGTKESGETPNWIQYTLLDEARIEMPLNDSKDETYPLGFAFDTASSHQVAIGENKLPVMPMIHLLSTYGHLVSYNFLNLSPNAVHVCSPPPPLSDVSGQFVPLSDTIAEGPAAAAQQVQAKHDGKTSEYGAGNKSNAAQGFGDMTFSLGANAITSTPAIKDNPTPLFGSQPKPLLGCQTVEHKKVSGFGEPTDSVNSSITTAAPGKPNTTIAFAAATSAPSNVSQFSQQFGGMKTGASFGGFSGTGFTAKPSEVVNPAHAQQNSNNTNKNTEVNKPLYTVPATFTPPNVPQQQTGKTEVKPIKPVASTYKCNLKTGEMDEVVKQMIVIQIEAFETELKQIRQQSKQLMENIGSPNEIKSYTKKLHDLHEIVEQANDHEFEQDVQSLRHSMNESYAMLAECRTKLDLHNNPNLTRLSAVSTTDPTSRRQLAKLQAYVASNQNQLSQLNQLIDAQWSQYQDVVRRNSKNQMHIPCLDGIYQRMSKLKDLLSRQRTKMNYIKTKLKEKGLHYKPANDNNVTSAAVGALTKNQSTMESLADSILSMSLSKVVSKTHAKLPEEKLNAIREFASRQQQIAVIKPKRPDRVGLKSEVILETKLETERKQKEMAKKQLQQQQQQQQKIQQLQQQQYLYQLQYQQNQQQLAAYNAQINYQSGLSAKPQQQQMLKPQAVQQQQQQPLLAKPTASKPAIVSSQPPTFITPTSSTAATFSFGGNSSFVKTSITVPKSEETITKPLATSAPFPAFNASQEAPTMKINATQSFDSKENKPNPAPISFAAKVIGGNDVKPFSNLSNKTTTQNNVMQSQTTQSFSVPASTGFSAFATTKPSTDNVSQYKDKAKNADEAPKQFSFNSAATSNVRPSANSTASFTAATKSKTATTTTASSISTPLFGANTTSIAATPFAVLSSSSPFVFNVAPTTVASQIASSATKAVTTTTSSSQSAGVVNAKPAEIKTNTSVPATLATITTSTTTSKTTASESKSSVAPNVTVTSSALPVAKPNAPAPTSNEDPTNAAFGSLNICKPTPKEAGDSNKAGNIFSDFANSTVSGSTGAFSFVAPSGAGDTSKSFSSSTATTSASTGFSFVSAASSGPASTNVFCKTTTTGPVALTTASESTTSSASLATKATDAGSSTAATTTIPASSPFSFTTASGTTVTTAGSLFGSLSVSSSTAAQTSSSTATSTTNTASSNIFGEVSSSCGQTATAANTSTTTSIFGGATAIASSAPSLFGSIAPVASSTSTTGSGSIFASTAANTSQPESIFGVIPKPEQSVFGTANNNVQAAGTGLFAAAAATTKPVSGTGGSIFGGSSSTGFGGATAGSIFGGGTTAASSPFGATAPANTAGSIFGAAAVASKPAENSNIFGSPTQQAAASGGSLFNKPSFGAAVAPQPTGSIFGGGNAQSPTSGGFATAAGSIFGSSSANTSASGGSLFGAATASTFGAPAASPGFGSFSQPSAASAFGAPSAGGFGAPTSGFGSPQQQSAFAKPVFGGSATFGSPQPAFGAPPTFGGAPTFGSPKGFGSFAATSPTAPSFAATNQAATATTTPKGNIFETLGSQESGLSFGNLAHSTQPPQQKPTFGGSSFMNYRS